MCVESGCNVVLKKGYLKDLAENQLDEVSMEIFSELTTHAPIPSIFKYQDAIWYIYYKFAKYKAVIFFFNSVTYSYFSSL